MLIYTGNKLAKFHWNMLSLSENIAKSFRRVTFLTHTIEIISPNNSMATELNSKLVSTTARNTTCDELLETRMGHQSRSHTIWLQSVPKWPHDHQMFRVGIYHVNLGPPLVSPRTYMTCAVWFLSMQSSHFTKHSLKFKWHAPWLSRALP